MLASFLLSPVGEICREVSLLEESYVMGWCELNKTVNFLNVYILRFFAIFGRWNLSLDFGASINIFSSVGGC